MSTDSRPPWYRANTPVVILAGYWQPMVSVRLALVPGTVTVNVGVRVRPGLFVLPTMAEASHFGFEPPFCYGVA